VCVCVCVCVREREREREREKESQTRNHASKQEFVNAVKDWADKMPLLPPLPPEAADAEEEMVPEEEEMAPEEEESAPGLGAGFAAGVLCAKTVS